MEFVNSTTKLLYFTASLICQYASQKETDRRLPWRPRRSALWATNRNGLGSLHRLQWQALYTKSGSTTWTSIGETSRSNQWHKALEKGCWNKATSKPKGRADHRAAYSTTWGLGMATNGSSGSADGKRALYCKGRSRGYWAELDYTIPSALSTTQVSICSAIR